MIESQQMIVNSTHLSLPNGVCALSDETIVVVNGGTDTVMRFTSEGKLIESIGESGYGKYRLKEPVGVFTDGSNVFVADWRNQRIVVYDSRLSYKTEFGYHGRDFLGDQQKGVVEKIRDLYYVYSSFYKNKSRTRYYFQEKNDPVEPETNTIQKMTTMVQSSYYWHCKRNDFLIDSFRKLFSGEQMMHKPNGVTFYRDRIYVSQKDAKCISIYDRSEFDLITHLERPNPEHQFGRLGNIRYSESSGNLYVCDERERVIWVLDEDGNYRREITRSDLGLTDFFPFSCCEIKDNILAVAGSKYLFLIDTVDKVVEYQSRFGEPHGVDFCTPSNTLYIADRCRDAIYSVDIQL